MTGKQLKNSLLQWAIQGKLVPQDPNDEPASVLLEKIRAEKARLIKEGKIKKDKKESIIYRGEDNSYYEKFADGKVICIDEEIPFELPKTWAWIRLKYVSEIARGGSPRPIKEFLTDSVDGINWIKIGDTEKDGMYINSTKEKIKPEGLSKSRLVHKGDFLLTNSMSFGRPYITNIDGCIHDGWLVISPIRTSYIQRFLYYLLSSGYAFSQFAGKVSGAVVKNLNSEKVADALFPLPPNNEQQRILDKLDELIPNVNTYGLVADAISAMNQSLKPKLRKSILQEAIQGRLVPQNASEEPATLLLQRIKEEKLRLVKEGKLKKKDVIDSTIFRGDDNKYYEKVGKETKEITEEIPFEIPTSWEWIRGKTAFHQMESTKPKGENFLYVDVDAVNNMQNVIDKAKTIVTSKAPSRATRKLHTGDVLFSMVRPYLRNIALVKEEYAEAIASTGFYVIRPTCALFSPYLFYLMLSSYVVDGLNQYMKGDNSPSINNGHIENYLYPLPPINEQKRIVSMIEKILDRIKG